MALGVNTLALRYAISLGVGYLAYLLILRLWAGWLVEPEERDERAADALEALSHVVPQPGGIWPASKALALPAVAVAILRAAEPRARSR